MEIAVEAATGRREVVVTVNDPDVPVADLLDAVTGRRPEGRIAIDGRAVPAERAVGLAGLCRGVEITATAPEEPAPQALFDLCVIGGTVAGRALSLSDGTYRVGREASNDLVLASGAISKRHCTLTVRGGAIEIADGDGERPSSSGTWVDGVRLTRPALVPAGSIIDLGAAQFVIRPHDDSDRASEIDPVRFANAQGEISFNRSPRPALPPAPGGIVAPKAPATAGRPTFNVATVAAPAAFGLVMVLVMHNAMFALFALMSPLMAVVNYAGSRRRHTKGVRRDARDFTSELEELDTRLKHLVAQERQRRHAIAPDLAEVVRRAGLPSKRLWERRRERDSDFLSLSVGLANLPWTPPVDTSREFDGPAPQVAECITKHSTLAAVPLTVDLAADGPIGIVGDREAALDLARALIAQAVVFHGPSDLQLLVLTAATHADSWAWAKWIPHVRDFQNGDERLLLVGPESAETVARRILAGASRDTDERPPMRFLVVDDHELTRRRDSPVRDLLKGVKLPATGIVIAPHEDLLPEVCTAIVTVTGGSGRATFSRPQRGERIEQISVAGLEAELARRCARMIARFEDPEIRVPGASLPHTVPLAGLLRIDPLDVAAAEKAWDAYDAAVRALAFDDPNEKPPLPAVLGQGEEGPVTLDLVNDGPHGLIGGTPGSGKTELLRSMVLSLAANASPRYLSFLFIDFKGEAGFATLNSLPHSVGLASNIDADQAERVLLALRAELEHRQRKFRQAGAGVQELHEFWAVSEEPLPRLVVVIDEFAQFVEALPDFKSTIVQIGRIGRTLGVHLVLATQRPAGVVSADLKETCNYGIALRANSPENSKDLIGTADAAAIPPRNSAGRGYLRVGNTSERPVFFQSAFSASPVSQDGARPLEVDDFLFGSTPAAATTRRGARTAGDRTELKALTDTLLAAWKDEPKPRRPWLPPLEEDLDLGDVIGESTPESILFARVDDIGQQSQPAFGWQPESGNLLLYGAVGSGTTTALASLALAIVRAHQPGDAFVYVLDCGAGELLPLEQLPAVGAVITATEHDRQLRLRKQLGAELRARKADPKGAASRPRIFVLLDDYGAFATGAAASGDLLAGIQEIFSEGPDVGIFVAATADRAGAVPMKLANVVVQKWVLRLADRGEYSAFRLPSSLPLDVPAGRGWLATTKVSFQIGRPSPGLAAAVAAEAKTGRRTASRAAAPPVETMPADVAGADLVASARVAADPWHVPVGISAATLSAAVLELHEGTHALIAGPPRASKSELLGALAAIVRAAAPEARIYALLGRTVSPLATSSAVDARFDKAADLAAVVAAPEQTPSDRPCLVLVDDAHLIANDDAFVAVLKSARPSLHVIAAGRIDELRAPPMFNHWTQDLRKSKTGVLLRVGQGSDFDFLGLSVMNRQQLDSRPGRGYLAVDGADEPVQITRHF